MITEKMITVINTSSQIVEKSIKRPEPEAHQRTPSWLLPSGPDQVDGPAVTRTPEFKVKCGGEGGIRTLGTVSHTHAFQACSLSHSDTSPALAAGKYNQKRKFKTSTNQ